MALRVYVLVSIRIPRPEWRRAFAAFSRCAAAGRLGDVAVEAEADGVFANEGRTVLKDEGGDVSEPVVSRRAPRCSFATGTWRKT